MDSFSLFARPLETVDDLPPTYTALREWEMNLPQHNLDLPFPEGRTGRYVLFSNSRQYQVGWNNKLNDMCVQLCLYHFIKLLSNETYIYLSTIYLSPCSSASFYRLIFHILTNRLMNTWLAHSSNRAYVFHDFLWTPSHYPWPISSFPRPDWIPSTPLNALISGPSAGGPWEKGDNAPRSISEAWFDVVCPKLERRIINTRDVKPQVNWADGKIIFEKWKRLLLEAPERCIEIVAATMEEDPNPETFDINFWSGPRSVSLWEEFKTSPVSRLLGTSRLVESAINANLRLFVSESNSRHLPPATTSVSQGKANAEDDPFNRVLSIHVRRGDFKEACLEHAAENSTFYNWNLLSFLPDKFSPPPPGPGVLPKGKNTPENEVLFLERCLPSAASITHKVRSAREAYLRNAETKAASSGGPSEGSLKLNRLTRSKTYSQSQRSLDVLYIMSNDRTEWLNDLKESLRRDGWAHIVTSRDLKFTSEQKDVGVAIDMDIGRRSAVFIGNGVSFCFFLSLSSSSH